MGDEDLSAVEGWPVGAAQYHQSHASQRSRRAEVTVTPVNAPSSISLFLASRWARRISASRIRRTSSGGLRRQPRDLARAALLVDRDEDEVRRGDVQRLGPGVVPRLGLDAHADLHRRAAGPVDLGEGAHDVADVHRAARNAISSIAAVTAGPPLCRCATAPAVRVGEPHDLAAVDVAEQVHVASGP